MADADYTLRQAKRHVATASARAEISATPDEAAWFDNQVERLNDSVANREGYRAMIVRIAGEGQFRLPPETADRLNELDVALDRALADGDEAFATYLEQMLRLVRNSGEELEADEFATSDCVLPAAGTPAEELLQLLTEEGLVPG